MTEGFARAWESMNNPGSGATNITVKMLNLPKGVNLRWPHVVNFIDPAEGRWHREWSTLTLTAASRQTAGIPFRQGLE